PSDPGLAARHVGIALRLEPLDVRAERLHHARALSPAKGVVDILHEPHVVHVFPPPGAEMQTPSLCLRASHAIHLRPRGVAWEVSLRWQSKNLLDSRLVDAYIIHTCGKRCGREIGVSNHLGASCDQKGAWQV